MLNSSHHMLLLYSARSHRVNSKGATNRHVCLSGDHVTDSFVTPHLPLFFSTYVYESFDLLSMECQSQSVLPDYSRYPKYESPFAS